MFTSIDKAITALVMAVLYFLNRIFGVELGLDESVISGIIMAVTPFLVWLIPNRPTLPPTFS